MIIRLFAVCLLSLLPASLFAMEFTVKRTDMRPIRAPTISVAAVGEIRSGDTEKLKAALASVDNSGVRDIIFTFDSPGGSLMESMEMGEYIASLSPLVSAQVGGTDQPGAICASACVYAYLAADYRYISSDARIGVHQFRFYTDEIDGQQGAALGQLISGMLSEYIRTHRARPEFFEAISGVDHDDIMWIPRQQLEDWRVVTNAVYDEREFYINLNGKIALRMEQIAITGDSFLTLFCSEGRVSGVADLHEPEFAAYGTFDLTVNGVEYPVDTWDIIDRDDGRGRIVFNMPSSAARAAMAARTLGARMVAPSRYVFFGFEQTLRAGLVPEMIRGCLSAAPAARGAMTELPATDFPGNDLTSNGIRDVSFARCKEICLEYEQCRAVSYVQARAWCWPKGQAGNRRSVQGVISAIKR
ncbi:hypothetical protein A8B83_11730 [Rhodobacteraceae bacterium EhC02]|nr:hypothetical protein A8B83_11730 [Rhodobacteraceae bacterium EhC02]